MTMAKLWKDIKSSSFTPVPLYNNKYVLEYMDKPRRSDFDDEDSYQRNIIDFENYFNKNPISGQLFFSSDEPETFYFGPLNKQTSFASEFYSIYDLLEKIIYPLTDEFIQLAVFDNLHNIEIEKFEEAFPDFPKENGLEEVQNFITYRIGECLLPGAIKSDKSIEELLSEKYNVELSDIEKHIGYTFGLFKVRLYYINSREINVVEYKDEIIIL